MKIGVLGTGMVGQGIGTKLVALGHTVKMGSRRNGNEKARVWASATGPAASEGSFEDAARFADEIVVNATAGDASLIALEAAGAANLAGKVLIDISNPLDFSAGFPPTLSVCNDDSMAEQIQRAFPEAHVVKTLNTVSVTVMVEPAIVPGSHNVFLSGNDARAKTTVATLLQSFGWPADDVIDLGDLSTARGVEMYLPLWLRLFGAFGSSTLNIKVARA